jgi:hypothetical protein
MACEGTLSLIESLLLDLDRWEERLQNAAPPEKAQILRITNRLREQEAAARQTLQSCWPRLFSPVPFGMQDARVPNANGVGSFQARIYYPSRGGGIGAPIINGAFPLVAFIHGNRNSSDGLCPENTTQDYTLWGAVLQHLAKCGIVVIAVDVHMDLFDPDNAARRAERAIDWMYETWTSRSVLDRSDVLVGGEPKARIGLLGHSWGARVCARIVRTRSIAAVGFIAGTWDETQSTTDIQQARVAKLFVAGPEDEVNAALSNNQPFQTSVGPKHQAAIQGAGHWAYSEIGPCPGGESPACGDAALIASELALGFFYKYLYDYWLSTPYLLAEPYVTRYSDRPGPADWFPAGSGCAVKVRWDDPRPGSMFGRTGVVTLGPWTTDAPPWTF